MFETLEYFWQFLMQHSTLTLAGLFVLCLLLSIAIMVKLFQLIAFQRHKNNLLDKIIDVYENSTNKPPAAAKRHQKKRPKSSTAEKP